MRQRMVDVKAMNRRVTREEWLFAAVSALADGGIGAVAVEPLARRLGVTKGSFYNYFDGLEAFWGVLLGFWEDQATESIIRELDAIAEPRRRLEQLFSRSWDDIEHLKAEAALMGAAVAGDARVRPAYLRVNRRRLDYVRALYRELGLDATAAERWAATAYGAYLGTLQLVALGASHFRTQAELRAHVAHLGKTLIPAVRKAR
jgi:AcrR family transcriptional regulator